MDSPTTMPAEDRPDGFGPYKVLDVLGEGGMGVVYLAEQRVPMRRQVALKVIKLGMDTREVLARFDAERQALALLDHPNIAKVLDAGSSKEGRPFFVMELVKGVPITDYCDRHKLDVVARQRLFLQVCHGLQHAHDQGVIHRDIKPQNVFVTLKDGEPFVKIIDFGVAKATNQRLTEKTLFTEYGRIIGTPEYMSPEQAEMTGLDVDQRTDVYSLGVLLYEILTGTLPFDPKKLRLAGYLEIQRKIREDQPPTPSKRVSTLGDAAQQVASARGCNPRSLRLALRSDLDWIVMRALEKDRTHRYASPAQFAAEVENHLAGRPTIARPRGALARQWRRLRRHPVRHLAIVTGAALLAGVGSSIWFAIDASQRVSLVLLEGEVPEKDVLDALWLQVQAGGDADAARRYEGALRRSLLPRLEDHVSREIEKVLASEDRSDCSGRLQRLWDLRHGLSDGATATERGNALANLRLILPVLDPGHDHMGRLRLPVPDADDNESPFGSPSDAGWRRGCQHLVDVVVQEHDVSQWLNHEDARAGLDSLRRMLDSPNHLLEVGGMQRIADLYERTLVAYATERLGAFAEHEATGIKRTLPAPGMVTSYEALAAGEVRLRCIAEGMRVLRTQVSDARTVERAMALTLWELAVDASEIGGKHFDLLLAMGMQDLPINAVDGNVASTLQVLRGLLGVEEKRDLATATALPLADLFPMSWKNLKEAETRFGNCSATNAEARHWSPKAQAVAAKGPLFSRLSTKAGAPTLEQFFAALQQDVDRAQVRTGDISKHPLRDFMGSDWLEHVEQKQHEFLSIVDSEFDANWTQLLTGIQMVAKEGLEAKDEDKYGSRRLGVVPELVAAYRIGRAVLERRGIVSAEMLAELEELLEKEQAKHEPSQAGWAKEPGIQRPITSPEMTIERSKVVGRFLASELTRITAQDWGLPSLNEIFQNLEASLIEAVCNREWGACRAEIEAFAKAKPFKAWNHMLAGFPFTPDATSDAGPNELAEAVGSMMDLADAMRQLEPQGAFALAPEFTADLEAVAVFCQILYGGTQTKHKPTIEARLVVETEGSIAQVRLDGESRSIDLPPSGEVDWVLGNAESLGFMIRMSSGETRSFPELVDARGKTVPANWLRGKRLVTGPWCLKRLFSIGETTMLNEHECMSTLKLRGCLDKVLLISKTLRKEAAIVFDASWPGDRYTLSNTMWKQP